MLGLVVFTVCSLLGGFAQSGGLLIAARAAQGIGGAILAPATLSLITTTFTEPQAGVGAAAPGRPRLPVARLSAFSPAASSPISQLALGSVRQRSDRRGTARCSGYCRLSNQGPAGHSALDVPGALTVTGGVACWSTRSSARHASLVVTTPTGTLAAALTADRLRSSIEARIASTHWYHWASSRQTFNLPIANGDRRRRRIVVCSGMYFFLSLYLQQVNRYSPLKAGLAFRRRG